MPSLSTRTSALLAALLAVGMLTGAVVAATSGSITADPNTPDATATHTVTATIDGGAAGSSWTGFQVTYEQTDVSNVGQNDIAKIGIDRGDDAAGDTIDVDVSSDLGSVSASSNGHTLTIGLGGNYNLGEGDEVVVVYDDVRNPSAGTYTVGLDVNHQSSGGETSATLSIESDTTTTTTTTQTTTTATQTTEETIADTTTDTTTTQTTTEETTATTTTDDATTDDDTTTQTTADTTTATTTTSDAEGARHASVVSTPATANTTATHAAMAVVGSANDGSSWTGFQIDYRGTGVDASNVGQGDVVTIGIDRGNDSAGTTVDVNVSDDLSSVSVSGDGQVVTVGLGGNYDLSAGDQVVVVYENVQNGPAGTYEVPVDVNHQSSGGSAVATLELRASGTSTTGTTTTNADQPATTDTTSAVTSSETTSASTTTAATTDSSGSSPGFGVAVALVAALAVAFLVRRDN